MNRNKRQTDDTTNNCHGGTRKRLQITSVNTNRSSIRCFEDIPNEIIYEIFELLDVRDLYKAFSNLNKRFENLLICEGLSIYINISSISKSTFEYNYTHYIVPNIQRIKSISSSNLCTIDLIHLSIFTRLETLTLNNIDSIHLENILKDLTSLTKLSSLIISTFNHRSNKTNIYRLIFRLPILKYCKISFEDDWDDNSLSISLNESSPIEHLVIKTKCYLNQLNALLSYLPQLRYFSCNDLNICYELKLKMFPNVLSNLTHVSLQLYNINFDRFQLLIRDLFYQLEVLYISTSDDSAYLDANRWERLILSYMPCLRIFDIKHTNFAFNNDCYETACQNLMNQFASSFWFERKWFFAHQHNWLGYLNNAIFYSTQPYRRKYYSLSDQYGHDDCPYRDENNLDLVRHVSFSNEKAIINSTIYFPNATHLTITCPLLLISDDLFRNTLNRIVPLVRLNKITILDRHFNFSQLIEMLCFTSNCHTLILDAISVKQQDSRISTQNETFQSISIKNITIKHRCTSRIARQLVNLCPQLEHLTMGISTQSLLPTVKFLLAKNNNNTRHLFSLYLLKTTTTGAQQLKNVINSEKLLNDYEIKMIGDDCYLWW